MGSGEETPARSIAPVTNLGSSDSTWDRLEDQIGWYDRKSGESQRSYKWLKLLEIAIALACRSSHCSQPSMGNWWPCSGDCSTGRNAASIPVPGTLDYLPLYC